MIVNNDWEFWGWKYKVERLVNCCVKSWTCIWKFCGVSEIWADYMSVFKSLRADFAGSCEENVEAEWGKRWGFCEQFDQRNYTFQWNSLVKS